MMQPEHRIERSDLGIDHVSLIPSDKIMDSVVDVFDVVCRVGKSTKGLCKRMRCSWMVWLRAGMSKRGFCQFSQS